MAQGWVAQTRKQMYESSILKHLDIVACNVRFSCFFIQNAGCFESQVSQVAALVQGVCSSGTLKIGPSSLAELQLT